jgi:hypothetical protein
MLLRCELSLNNNMSDFEVHCELHGKQETEMGTISRQHIVKTVHPTVNCKENELVLAL